MLEKINAYFENEKIVGEMLSDLSELIEIPSVRGEREENAPFGAEPKRALLKMLSFAGRDGFHFENIDNCAGEIDMNGNQTALGILVHLDVVPAGEGWNCEPFKMTVCRDKIYGRGTSDDKGAVIAAYYAMKAVREIGTELKSNVRLIVGTAEETGSPDIEHYMSVRKMPPSVFTPDSSFPVTNIEKGRFSKSFCCDYFCKENKGIVSFDGGVAANAVPSRAEAVIKGYETEFVKIKASFAEKVTGVSFACEESGNCIKISADGTGAHASMPHLGNNAVTALVYLLSLLEKESEKCDIFCRLNTLFPHGTTDGSALGVKMSDVKSGALTLTLDILKIENGKLTGVFDSRTPLCSDTENTAYVIRDRLKENGFDISDTVMVPVHHVDENSRFVRELLSSYEKVTGRKGYCAAIGGGTYVHGIDGGVAFGAIMPETDTNMHGADEFMYISELVSAAKIFALAIIRLCS